MFNVCINSVLAEGDSAFFYIFQMIPVAANDVAFSVHAVLLTAISLFQIAVYDVSNMLPLIELIVLVMNF